MGKHKSHKHKHKHKSHKSEMREEDNDSPPSSIPKLILNSSHQHRDEDYDSSPPTSIPKLILKIGGATPEREDSPALHQPVPSLVLDHEREVPQEQEEEDSHMITGDQYFQQDSDLQKKHKKKKKKKEKKKKKKAEKEKEKKHKHHHKEKRKREYQEMESREHSESTSPELGSPSKRVCLEELDSEPPILVREVSPFDPEPPILVREVSPREMSPREVSPSPSPEIQKKSDFTNLLEFLLRELEKKDVNNFFRLPVIEAFAPGYSRIVQTPMDFSTIRMKIEEGRYDTLHKFRVDFELICTNCMLYNMPETIYHKAAQKLLQQGQRILSPERLRLLAEQNPVMHQISTKELGFKLVEELVEFTVEDEREVSLMIEEVRGLVKRPPGRFEAIPDDMSPEEILEQVTGAAARAKQRLDLKQPQAQVGFLRQSSDGSIMFSMVTGEDEDRPISLDNLIGDVKQGTVNLQTFREEKKKNEVVEEKARDVLHKQALESNFTNLSKDDMVLVENTYGDCMGVAYAESIKNFSRNCEYATFIVDNLLDILTGNEHRKTSKHIEEQRVLRSEEDLIASAFPSPNVNSQIDFEDLKTLEEVGIDMSFLETIKKTSPGKVEHVGGSSGGEGIFFSETVEH